LDFKKLTNKQTHRKPGYPGSLPCEFKNNDEAKHARGHVGDREREKASAPRAIRLPLAATRASSLPSPVSHEPTVDADKPPKRLT
jgi:hypothetical protein